MAKYDNTITYNPSSCAIEIKFDICEDYYIAGVCLRGSRHYSEHMTYDKATREFPKYVSVVEYFGGGEVQLFRGEKLIKSVIVF